MMPSTLPMPFLERAASNEYEPRASSATNTQTLETLSWLLRYPLLRTSDLATLMGLSASATAARLARVQSDGYVRSVSAALLGRQVARLHALTSIGLAYLVDHDGPIVWERARRSQADTAGLLKLMSDLPGVLVTQSIVLALIAHAEVLLCQQASQHVTWSWTRNMRLRPLRTGSDPQASYVSQRGDAGVGLRLRVAAHDAIYDLASQESPADSDTVILYRFIIVWDSGLSQPHDIRRQLQSFLRIRDSYERQGCLASFPTLLVLSPDARRADLWQAQALRLATERWLTHPLLGGALALDDHAPLLSFPPVVVDCIDPWRTMWRSFALPGAQTLNNIVQADGKVGVRLPTQSQAPRRTGRMHDAVELARLILRLDARSLRMLTALYLYPLLSTQQLAVVLGIKPTSAERMVRHLHALDLVQMQVWSGVQQGVLADRGVLLLARCAHLSGGARAVQASGRPPRVLRRYQREVRALARTPEHTSGVYGFFTGLLQSCAAERSQGHDAALPWWETGSRCARAFRDAGGWQVIRPDGAGEWRVGNQRFRFWLEWDRGTMGPRDLTAKFTAYARYLRSGEWRTDGNEPLPYLLIVTSDVGQETRIVQALQSAMAGATPLAILITQAVLLAERGPLAPIWRPLTSEVSACRIRIGASYALFTLSTP